MATRTRRSSSGSSRRARSEDSGGRLNRDYSDEEFREPSEGYQGTQPNRGLYTAELVGVRDHTKKDDEEATSIRWSFRLPEGTTDPKTGDDVSGFMDSIYTNENTLWREQQILVATGVIKPNGKCNLSYEQIVKKAKPCTVRIGRERYIPEDGSDPEWRGRMEAFMTLRDETATKRRRPKDEPVEEIDTDEDEGDTDEWPEDPDELAEALEELDLAELKKVAQDDFDVKVTRRMESEDIIEAILDTLEENEGDDEGDEPDEDEPEEEPEPPKRSSRRSRAAKEESDDDGDDEEEAKPTRSRRARGASAGKTTRTRRSKASDDDVPF